MSNSLAFSIYSKLPVPLQNLVCSLAGLKMRSERYGKIFHKAYDFLIESEWWDEDKLINYQNRELRKIISHAYQTVPYYHNLFDKLKLKPSDIQSKEDLKKLPILTKKIVREQSDNLHSIKIRNWEKKYTYTGGTTGSSLKIAYTLETSQWQWALTWRHRNRFGININDQFIVFAGRDVVPTDNMKPPIWRRNLPMKQTYVSIHHLTRENLPVLAEYLRNRKVKYYLGYPSALYTIAHYFKEYDIFLNHPPQMAFTGSETLLPHQRELIQKAFSTKVSDLYGASEFCVNISECEKFSYHIDMEFGIIEFIPIPGLPPNVCKIVCTGLRNYAMPLIRYEIGDIVTVNDKKCACGRKLPTVEKIDGRIESYIITPDGRQLGRLDFLFKKSNNIEEAQLIQNEISKVKFRIVKSAKYNNEDEKKLIETIHTYMGKSFEIILEYVDAIPKEKNGKFRQIISSVFKDKIQNDFDKNEFE